MRFLAVAILSSMLAASCASTKDVGNLEKRIAGLEQQSAKSIGEVMAINEEIKREQARIDATLTEIKNNILVEIDKKQKRLDDNQTTILRNSADDKEDHRILTNRVEKTFGIMDETIHALKLDQERLKKLEGEVATTRATMMESFLANTQRMDALKKQISDLGSAAPKPAEGKKKKGKTKSADDAEAEPEDKPATDGEAEAPTAKPAKQTQSAKTSTGSSSPEEIYNSAYDDFLKGNFPQARAKFSEFIKRYPGNELSYNSQYWIGEAYANQGKTKEAVEAFTLTASNYPKSTKAPAALFRAGELLEKSGGVEDAKAVFKKVRDNYPASYEAVMAEEKLRKTK